MYTTATFIRLDSNGNGGSAIVLAYTGDSGEKSIEESLVVDSSIMPTADYVRGIAMARITRLNSNINFRAGAIPFIGTVLDTTTPLPVITPTSGEYVAVTAPFTPGANPQDVFTIIGSDTKIVLVTEFGLNTVQGTTGLNIWYVLKRSTANSGGTSTLVPTIPIDGGMPAATAVVRQYTVNPTEGTLVGGVGARRIASPAVGTAQSNLQEFGLNPVATPIVLTGAAQSLSWNFGAAALPSGLSVMASVRWQERLA